MKPTHISPHPSFATTSILMNDQLSGILCNLLSKITKALISLQINTSVDRQTTPTPTSTTDTLNALVKRYDQTHWNIFPAFIFSVDIYNPETDLKCVRRGGGGVYIWCCLVRNESFRVCSNTLKYIFWHKYFLSISINQRPIWNV